MTPRPWRLRRPVPQGARPWKPLEDAWGLSSAAARLAWMRGVDDPQELAWRLDPAWSRTFDPWLMEGMGAAVARVQAALARNEGICVYGDYDVDGVTATALLVRVLERLGARVHFFIPNRFDDGYGLHLDCIREILDRWQPGLLISVDCGIRSSAEVAASRELGLDWIITDHHALGEGLPEAAACLHAHLGDYPNRHLAGVGVAFKLAQALLGAAPTPGAGDQPFLDGLLKLVALGTLADMVPLVGENALLAKRGLQALGRPNGPGLDGLLRAARCEGSVRSRDIAFGVGPRLNSVGRMGGAEEAVRLLLARDAGEAGALLARVEALNTQRRSIQRELAELLREPGDGAFDLVVEPTAHKGVIGIVAGQRMHATGRPSGVCTVLDGVVHGSLRAPEGYDLTELLEQARPFLRTGGGHRAAAGVTFDLSRLSFVQETFQRGAAEQARRLESPALPVDGAGEDTIPGFAELLRLEPFGQGFPEPRIAARGQLDRPAATFGHGALKLRLQGFEAPLNWFAPGPEVPTQGQTLSLAVGPEDHPRWGRSWRVEAPLALECRGREMP